MDPQTVATLRAAIVLLARRLRHQFAGDEALNATEMAVLGRIARCGPMTPSQLARAEHMRPPSMTKVIDNLKKHGFLRCEPHPTDGRRYWVVCTEAAEAFIAATTQARSQWLTIRVADLSEADRRDICSATMVLTRLAELP